MAVDFPVSIHCYISKPIDHENHNPRLSTIYPHSYQESEGRVTTDEVNDLGGLEFSTAGKQFPVTSGRYQKFPADTDGAVQTKGVRVSKQEWRTCTPQAQPKLPW